MMPFQATHTIVTTDASGANTYWPVMLVDGAAYTRAEWDWDTQADWECSDDGVWTFQGKATPDGAHSVRVQQVGS